MDKTYMKEYLEAPIRLHNIKLECLQKRLVLMPEGKTDYEKNEAIIAKIETSAEIKALSQIIEERKAYYLNYWTKEFCPAVEDMEDTYGEVVTRARKLAEKSQEIKDQLARVEFVPIGNVNFEGKLMNFQMLKKLMK